jgi:hypothetical protein
VIAAMLPMIIPLFVMISVIVLQWILWTVLLVKEQEPTTWSSLILINNGQVLQRP